MEDLFELLEINGLCKEWDIVVFAKGVILKEINQFLSSDRPQSRNTADTPQALDHHFSFDHVSIVIFKT